MRVIVCTVWVAMTAKPLSISLFAFVNLVLMMKRKVKMIIGNKYVPEFVIFITGVLVGMFLQFVISSGCFVNRFQDLSEKLRNLDEMEKGK